jgi:hypothetical protein
VPGGLTTGTLGTVALVLVVVAVGGFDAAGSVCAPAGRTYPLGRSQLSVCPAAAAADAQHEREREASHAKRLEPAHAGSSTDTVSGSPPQPCKEKDPTR